MKLFLYRWLLPRLISKICDARISRSGDEGKKVNCYVVAINKNKSPFFLATDIDGESLSGLEWDGDSYANVSSVDISTLKDEDLQITHFYGLSEVKYTSIYDYAWHYITKYVYLKIKIHRFIDGTFQYFYNKRKIVSKNRLDLLQFMIEDQLLRDHDGIPTVTIMSKIYSTRMFLHPSWQVQLKKLKLYLDSLVDSGDLSKNTVGEFAVTGRAIHTIEKYEEEERRHTEAVKIQKRMFWLTIVAIIFTVIQTGIIKVPTMLEFTDSSTQKITNKDKIKQAENMSK